MGNTGVSGRCYRPLDADDPVPIPGTVDITLVSYVYPVSDEDTFPEDIAVESPALVNIEVVDIDNAAETFEGARSGRQFDFTLRLTPESEFDGRTVTIAFQYNGASLAEQTFVVVDS